MAALKIMKMNIKSDSEGYFYFNEILYAFFRYQILLNEEDISKSETVEA